MHRNSVVTREEGPVHRFFGPPGSPRRRRLRALPVIGLSLRLALSVYRAVRNTWIEIHLGLQRARIDLRNRRAVTASNVTRRNSRRAYERVYGDDRLMSEYLDPQRLLFYEEVAEAIAPFCSQKSVVDIGCGTGNLLREVVDRAAPTRVVGVDYTDAGVRRARKCVPEGEFHARSLYELDLAETFDVVLCTEVLEHLSKPDAAMRVLTRLCSPSGVIFVTVPDGALDSWSGHRNFWGEPELLRFLGRYGDADVSRMASESLSLFGRLHPGVRRAGGQAGTTDGG